MMENVAELAGCRLAFDDFASTSLPLCVGENWRKYKDLAIQILSTEQKIIVKMTGCLGKVKQWKLINGINQKTLFFLHTMLEANFWSNEFSTKTANETL